MNVPVRCTLQHIASLAKRLLTAREAECSARVETLDCQLARVEAHRNKPEPGSAPESTWDEGAESQVALIDHSCLTYLGILGLSCSKTCQGA